MKKENYQTPPDTVRLNKFVASAGICSRRKADEHIANGKVTVNGKVIREMGYRVKDKDVVTFDGKVIRPEEDLVYLLLNKPKNTITTMKDERGRRTVMDLVGKVCPQRIFPVGRLDRNTTGLLLFTNDGELAKRLAHPSYSVRKVYHVVLDKPITDAHLNEIRATLQLEDGPAPVDAVSHIEGKGREEVGIEIHIGRNRIVRRIFAHLGYHVDKLDRVIYASLNKKNLPRGRYRFLTKQEIIRLKHLV